jgi:hypothetical protein
MVHVQIGTNERKIQDADPSWVHQQINRRRQDAQTVCVKIQIDDHRANMRLTTPGCDEVGGGNRPPNAQEKEIFALWDRHGLNRDDFSGGNVVEFLKRLIRLLGD